MYVSRAFIEFLRTSVIEALGAMETEGQTAMRPKGANGEMHANVQRPMNTAAD